ncbi:MAG: hypothetical protein ACR2QW_03675 [bacterium]
MAIKRQLRTPMMMIRMTILLTVLLALSCGTALYGQEQGQSEVSGGVHSGVCNVDVFYVGVIPMDSSGAFCKRITGHVTVADFVTDLGGLLNLVHIDKLSINSTTQLPTLYGLSGLESVGDLEIKGNQLLTVLSELNNLKRVERSLTIQGNATLVHLGLNSLEAVGTDFSLSGNNVLLETGSLEKLTSVGDTLSIDNNPNLISLEGLQNLSRVRVVSVHDNDSLFMYHGLRGLVWGNTTIRISRPANIEEHFKALDEPSCTAAGGEYYIEILSDNENVEMWCRSDIHKMQEIWKQDSSS